VLDPDEAEAGGERASQCEMHCSRKPGSEWGKRATSCEWAADAVGLIGKRSSVMLGMASVSSEAVAGHIARR